MTDRHYNNSWRILWNFFGNLSRCSLVFPRSDNALAGIQIRTKSNPIVCCNRIHSGLHGGIYVVIYKRPVQETIDIVLHWWAELYSQKMSRCDENVRGTLGCISCATFLFLLQIVVICELCSQRNNKKSFIILRLCPVPRLCLLQSALIFSILCYTCSSCSSIAFFGFFLIPKQIFCIAA